MDENEKMDPLAMTLDEEVEFILGGVMASKLMSRWKHVAMLFVMLK